MEQQQSQRKNPNPETESETELFRMNDQLSMNDESELPLGGEYANPA